MEFKVERREMARKMYYTLGFIPWLIKIIWYNRKTCPYWKGYGKICDRRSLTPDRCKLGDAMYICVHFRREG